MAQITEISEQRNSENNSNKSVNSSATSQSGNIQKTKFQIECERGVSIEEARQHTHAFIKQLWKK